MGTERLCKTKEREEGEEDDSMVGMKQPGWQQRTRQRGRDELKSSD